MHDIEIPFIEEAGVIDLLIMLTEASSYHQKWLRSKPESYQPDVRLLLKVGELVLATDYLQAQRRRTVFNNSILNLFNQVDIYCSYQLSLSLFQELDRLQRNSPKGKKA